MTSSLQWLSIVNTVLFGFEMAGVLVIVWIGWLRTRRVAYIVLAGWALATLAGIATAYLPFVQSIFGGTNNSQTTYQIMMWINLLRTLVSSVLLLAGLGMLVFNERRAEPQPGAS